jgi:hypothetical protein
MNKRPQTCGPACFLGLALALITTAAAQAQCDVANLKNPTVFDVYKCFWDAARGTAASSEMKPKIENANTATTVPDPFAARIHSSYENFFKLLSVAVNKVEESEDGQALMVRFNPLREGRHLLGFTLTATKPEIFEDVGKHIPEGARQTALEALRKQLTDTEDLTFTAAYSLQSARCATADLVSSRCWGRGPKVYRQVLSELLAQLVPPPEDGAEERQEAFEEIVAEVPDFAGDLFAEPWAKLGKQAQLRISGKLQQIAESQAGETLRQTEFYRASGINFLAALTDNQPQLAATVSYRDQGSLGGPDETGASLELQFGLANLNTLFRDANGNPQTALAKLGAYASDGLPADKFVLTASYKRRSSYSLSELPLTSPIVGFTPVRLGSTWETKARLQFGREISMTLPGDQEDSVGAKVGPQRPRWDVSAEGLWNREDGSIRTKERFVAAWTLTIPYGDQMSLPLSVTWANKPEFLGDQRQRIGVHLGISYRLPWEPAP